MTNRPFRFGVWLADPLTNSVEHAGERRQMEPRAMDVLVVLCKAAGAVVSVDELLAKCWGTRVYGDNPVHKVLNQLRRILGDTAAQPVYIETLRKRGYRTLADVSFDAAASAPAAAVAWAGGSPFRGLHAFDEAHASLFFGRGEETRRLLEVVQAQVDAGVALQIVLGPSGSGKSSLVRAGLFPALAAAGRAQGLVLLSGTIFDLAELGEQPLATALASSLLDLDGPQGAVFPAASAQSLGERLQTCASAVVQELHAMLASLAQAGRQLRFGLFIDHFETIFAASRGQAERQAFLCLLEQLARSQAMLVVIGCRNDFYPAIAQHALLMEGKPHGAHFDLAPPGSADLAQMIRLPAAAAGLRFGVDPHSQARLDDVLCVSVSASTDALPLLQYCLHELYRLRSEDGELSFDAFHAVGGVEGAIAQRAEQVVSRFDEAQQQALARVMSLLVLIAANEETVTSRRAPWSALRAEAERQVVHALVESRLFVSDLLGDAPGFGIAHEALLRRWPRMQAWIDAHRNALIEHARLARQAARWAREGRSQDFLLPHGSQLEAAQALQAAGVFALSDDELQLISVSARRSRLLGYLRRLAMATIALLVILATGLGLNAVAARHLAEQRRVEAEGLMGYMLGDFADKLRPLGQLDLLDSVSSKALHYLGAPQGKEVGRVALTQRAQALQVIGEVRRAHGDPGGAAEALASANTILLQLRAQAPADTEVLKNLGVNAYWLGQLSKDRGDLRNAGAAWQMYRQFSDELNRLEPDKVAWWVEQSYAHNNLGSLAVARDDPATAAQEFLRSIALKRRALQKTPESPMLLAELADSYSWLGSAQETLGNLSDAGVLYAQEMRIVGQLRQIAPHDALWVEREARALQHRASNLLARGLDAQALDDYRVAREQFSRITVQDKKNLNWQSDVADLEIEELAILARTQGDAALLASMTQAHARLAALLQRDPQKIRWVRREAMASVRLGSLLLRQGQLGQARQHAQRAAGRLLTLDGASQRGSKAWWSVAQAMLLLADIERASQDGAAASAACRQAYEMAPKNAGASLDFQILDPWARVNDCLGNDTVAAQAVASLRDIGYQDGEYLRSLSLHTNHGQQ